jgi:DNA-binding transcriptional MerR regulator
MNGKMAAKEAGITYRKLDYWVRAGIIKPTGPGQRGIDREFTDRDMAILKLAAMMRDKKISLPSIQAAVESIPDTWQPSEGGFLIGKTKLFIHPQVFDPPRKNYVLSSIFKVIMWEYLSVEVMNSMNSLPIYLLGNLWAEGMHKHSMVGYVLELSTMQLISIKKNKQTKGRLD